MQQQTTARERTWIELVLRQVREVEAQGHGTVEIKVHRGMVSAVTVRREKRISVDAA